MSFVISQLAVLVLYESAQSSVCLLVITGFELGQARASVEKYKCLHRTPPCNFASTLRSRLKFPERCACVPNLVTIGWDCRTYSRNLIFLSYTLYTSSFSRMRVINHNWSATKQRLHPQSVAEISRHSVLSGDRIRRCDIKILTDVPLRFDLLCFARINGDGME